MNDLIKSISIPAILYKTTEQHMIPNEKAYEILKNNISIQKNLENMLKYVSKKDFEEYLKDIYIIGENENLISFYCLKFDDSSEYKIIIIQDISMALVETIKNKSNNVLLEPIKNNIDIIATDEKGIILNISRFFEKFYNVKSEELLGKSVFELEKSGVFYPSATCKVLKTGQRVTMLQKNRLNREILVTALPIKDNTQNISRVICFSYDITDLYKIKKQIGALEKNAEIYMRNLKSLESKKINFPNVVGKSKEMQKIFKLITKIADFDVNVIITGESGVGKSYFAKLIHNISRRNKAPFVEVNCGAIPENLLESELFGYEGGSFTGAKKEGKLGLIESAQNGTLFLDEIAEMSLNLQVKLLKVIQDKTFNRIGGRKAIKVNFRLITATNRDLKDLIRQRKFREDLFYRLNVVSIHIPALRRRKEDIIALISYFMEKFNKKYNLNKKLSHCAMNSLINYEWIGNIRELENMIERTLLISEGDLITEEFLPDNIKNSHKEMNGQQKNTLQEDLDNYEKDIIVKAFEKYKTTVGVAKALGISQATAVRKIKKYVRKYS
ncbi:sigma-54 interaction domain-containing protein [Clostridium sp. JS66]|uniref:sigma-54 interaction domain-containing protein n=1 Tax=Clostridium sp. JS66 TaxID=3064705 RepID=UPI00298E7B6E|nr:sigma 54-interacting transcriptional regulator [Clostridium sp. JS66]WPC42414.1 sigma 54-interacting transcriptional regulator [Clostridium sp. JS66]